MNDIAKSNPTFLGKSVPKWIKDLDLLVRGEATRLSALRKGIIDIPSDGLQVGIIILGMIYGLCLGCFTLLKAETASVLQLLSGMVKVPALFLLTLLVTFPSLYIFNALVGSRLSIVALWRLLVAALAVTVTILASLGPIVAFFSVSTTSYSFMLLLNVFVFGLSGLLGLKFLMQSLHRLSLSGPTPDQSSIMKSEPNADTGALDSPESCPQSTEVKLVFRCWVVVFALVGSQMSWVLRPFLGSPREPFAFFRSRESNFFEAVWSHLIHLFN